MGFYGCFSYTHDQWMGLQAIMNVGYVHTIKYKLINYSWTMAGWMATVGKGLHFLQKNPPIEFSGYGPDATNEMLLNWTYGSWWGTKAS